MGRQLICAGQTAVDGEGNPQHAADMRGQIELSLNNLEAVLADARMTLANVIQVKVYTTDVDEALKNFGVLGARFGRLDAAPPMTLLVREPACASSAHVRDRSDRCRLRPDT